ncbi:MAG: NUDIX domain-containing protein [Chloroflexota bacterium]|nr:NUDIX hydrolase [Anaerolineales bacterium]MCA9974157.1 NUDIX hydrolase [Anaerolineales bacterium]MCB8968749.1 NUDIX hydrolase [Ardenticatenaceae bacterium]
MIHCYNDLGKAIPVAPELVQFRPAVYGILIDEYGQVLLLHHTKTDLWHPPGGILSTQETPKQAVRVHFRRIMGSTPQVGSLLHIENQYHITDDEQAWHLCIMYYAMEKPTLSTTTLGESVDADIDARWVPIPELDRTKIQFGWEAIQAGQLQQKLSK